MSIQPGESPEYSLSGETVHPSTLQEASSDQPVLLASHLVKHFPVYQFRIGQRRMVHAVEDITLALYPQHVSALVGESGSGKTTVARMLGQVYPPTKGQILLRGQPVSARRGRAFRAYCREVQYIFQDPFSSLNPIHTVRHALSRPLRIHRHVHSAAEEETQLATLLARVNLTPAEQYLDKYPHELSGGQRQRIAIARALAARPTILLADEPISMLDVSIRLDILNLLRRLKDEDHLALLYITHDIASARYFADDTSVMYAGQLVEGGPSEQVTQEPAHPYTQLLLSAAPDPARFGPGTENAKKRVLPARGEPPSLITPPTGCRFHPRCPHAMEVCRQQFPPRSELGGGHWTHCWLYSAHDGSRGAAPGYAGAPAS